MINVTRKGRSGLPWWLSGKNPKGNQSWIFTGKDRRWSWSSNTLPTWCEELTYWKRLGKIESRRRREQQRMRWLDGITDSMDEFEQAPGDDEGQGSLAGCSPWGHKELDTTEWLNLSSKESACQCRRHEFDPWSGKIPQAAGQLSPCATTIEPVL